MSMDQLAQRRDVLERMISGDPMLRSLSKASQSLLKSVLQPIELAENGVLFRCGAAADGCYFVERGALNVSVEDHTGGEVWLAILGSGDWVGELGLIDRHPRSATVAAMTTCHLWRLSMSAFDSLCQTDVKFYRSMVQLICLRLRNANQEVTDQRLDLEARLARTMLKLATAFGKILPDGRTLICYQIGQARLAELAGASRENVNRQFKAWKASRLCERLGDRYCLSNLKQWKSLGQGVDPIFLT